MRINECLGAVAGYIPKKLSAARTSHAAEDCGLLDDAQEGFRRNRSTKRQLGKLHSMFAEQRRRKQALSVVLYLDIKNAFNAVNHRVVYHVLEAKGFPAADINSAGNCKRGLQSESATASAAVHCRAVLPLPVALQTTHPCTLTGQTLCRQWQLWFQKWQTTGNGPAWCQ